LHTLTSFIGNVESFVKEDCLDALGTILDGEDLSRPILVSKPSSLPYFQYGGSKIPALAICHNRWNLTKNKIYFGRALAAGYRHIETKMHLEQEPAIRHVLRSSRMKRTDVHITSIIQFNKDTMQSTVAAIKDHADKMDRKIGCIDLLLVQKSDNEASTQKLWEAAEKAVEEQIVKEVGVCNFEIEDLEALKRYAKLRPPMVNRIEVRLHSAPMVQCSCRS
jgi:diketogulonate reductase-like aldo/keto reductase